MNTVIQKLKNDHRRFARLIRRMEWELDRCHHGEGLDTDAMAAFVDYCSRHADEHHHPLEDRLFQRMLDRDPGLRGTIEQLNAEHVELDEATRTLHQLLEAIRADNHVSRDEFLGALARYLFLYHGHMDVEESELFRRADSLLWESDWQALERWLAEQPPSPFEDASSHDYQRIERLMTSF
ncbi:hemerythrin domain-containing protein [Natronospira bacteriovora]|uniref:Hemerythrin domain-containing protein n=1 Tax=Natronospira bacteriovora TaxID=3069753 RepID=A0ABU0W4I8_9GAMM|nr:hemerythrin domain-containing protein [Natronospira sp. AB-CW4]MDQ2068668.1 hemerythrin domain-containing protein [Natronospira sp. AB-CW4]